MTPVTDSRRSAATAVDHSRRGRWARIKHSLREAAIPVLKPFLLAAGLGVFCALRLASYVTRIRVGLLAFDRIGHLSSNTEVFLRNRFLGRETGICLLISGKPANRQLLAMIKRRACVLDLPGMSLFFVHGLKPFLRGSDLALDLEKHLFEYEPFACVPAQLSLIGEEEARGRRELEKMGVPPGAPFVCFHARDKAYLENSFVHRTREQWAYQDYRDCDINNYLPAAERLAASGLFAVRMGQAVEKPLSRQHSRVIDYANRHRSDFLDVYLVAKCKFFLGSTAGLCCLATTLDVPIAIANLTPFGNALWRRGDLLIHKKYRDARRQRLLSFRELLAMGADLWFSGHDFARAGIELMENSADEIAALAAEMNARLDGTWVAAPEDEELQDRYWSLFPEGHPARRSPCRVGAQFLRENEPLLA